MPSPKISTAIQHHPKRGDLLRPLISSLTPGPPPQVVFDPDPDGRPSPWRCYRRCLEVTPSWATHRVILQDDALVCRDFPETARRAIAARPEALIVFCVLGAPHRWKSKVLHAGGLYQSWAELDVADYPSWIPVVAVSWPAPTIAPALAWVDEQAWWPVEFTADDEIVGRICAALRLPVWATVPSLVDHPDVVESAVGRRYAAAGANPARTTPCFVAADCDPLSIVWE